MNEIELVRWVDGIEEAEAEHGIQIVSAFMANATDTEAEIANIELERRGCDSRVITLGDVERGMLDVP